MSPAELAAELVRDLDASLACCTTHAEKIRITRHALTARALLTALAAPSPAASLEDRAAS